MQTELELMLRGQGEAWSEAFLLATIKCDHGFTASSPTVQHFVAVLAAMAPPEQRAFLRFVTGSPRLPPGGLAALRPQVTLVMKHGSQRAPFCIAPAAVQSSCWLLTEGWSQCWSALRSTLGAFQG